MSGMRVEWPTLAMMVVTYVVWALGLSLWDLGLWGLSPLLSVLLVTLAVTQHSSLQHEVLHGHPFKNHLLSEALVFPAIGVFISYLRFKDTHLQHHYDPALTDPYDDPEANYMDPAVWAQMGALRQRFYRANNTLAGRILLGPGLAIYSFLAQDLRDAWAGDRRIRFSYALHLPGVVMVLAAVIWSGMPIWAYLISTYMGLGILKIRTYLEHRAHISPRARSVIIEDRGVLSYLFLNNNFHAVHHSMPNVAWYDLPALYVDKRAHFQRRNEDYVYQSYGPVFRQFLFRAKDPVPHPIWPVEKTAE